MIRELGFRYDSSLMADDEPYLLLADGETTGIVEIPVEWIRDDAPYFMMQRYCRPASLHAAALGPPDLDRRVRGARAEGGLFQLTLHPHVIGHRSRLVVLRALLEHIRGYDDVWCATHADIADLLHPRSVHLGRRPS